MFDLTFCDVRAVAQLPWLTMPFRHLVMQLVWEIQLAGIREISK